MDEHFVVGFVGRLVPDKGVSELVEAVRSLHKQNLDVILILAGPRESRELDLPLDEDRLIALGPLDNTRSAYWAFDIFCLPSHREGFPISTLEAEACGLPVVTTSATGCRDSMGPDHSGFMVEPRDSGALALAIRQLISKPALRASMSRNARQFVEENFDRRDVNKRFRTFLELSVQGP